VKADREANEGHNFVRPLFLPLKFYWLFLAIISLFSIETAYNCAQFLKVKERRITKYKNEIVLKINQ
jgi:hypothetical protein